MVTLRIGFTVGSAPPEPRPPGSDGGIPVDPAETMSRVLGLVDLGMANKQIARRLETTERTARLT